MRPLVSSQFVSGGLPEQPTRPLVHLHSTARNPSEKEEGRPEKRGDLIKTDCWWTHDEAKFWDRRNNLDQEEEKIVWIWSDDRATERPWICVDGKMKKLYRILVQLRRINPAGFYDKTWRKGKTYENKKVQTEKVCAAPFWMRFLLTRCESPLQSDNILSKNMRSYTFWQGSNPSHECRRNFARLFRGVAPFIKTIRIQNGTLDIAIQGLVFALQIPRVPYSLVIKICGGWGGVEQTMSTTLSLVPKWIRLHFRRSLPHFDFEKQCILTAQNLSKCIREILRLDAILSKTVSENVLHLWWFLSKVSDPGSRSTHHHSWNSCHRV